MALTAGVPTEACWTSGGGICRRLLVFWQRLGRLLRQLGDGDRLLGWNRDFRRRLLGRRRDGQIFKLGRERLGRLRWGLVQEAPRQKQRQHPRDNPGR